MAAKKNFRDNPALQFISGEAEEEKDVRQSGQNEEAAPSGKAQKNGAPIGYKPNPAYIETRSKRLQLVLQPSVYERVKAAAEESGLSVNEYCHQILDKATKKAKNGGE